MSTPLANIELESEGKAIPSNEANGTNEGQKHLYENDQSWNRSHKSKVDARRVSEARDTHNLQNKILKFLRRQRRQGLIPLGHPEIEATVLIPTVYTGA